MYYRTQRRKTKLAKTKTKTPQETEGCRQCIIFLSHNHRLVDDNIYLVPNAAWLQCTQQMSHHFEQFLAMCDPFARFSWIAMVA